MLFSKVLVSLQLLACYNISAHPLSTSKSLVRRSEYYAELGRMASQGDKRPRTAPSRAPREEWGTRIQSEEWNGPLMPFKHPRVQEWSDETLTSGVSSVSSESSKDRWREVSSSGRWRGNSRQSKKPAAPAAPEEAEPSDAIKDLLKQASEEEILGVLEELGQKVMNNPKIGRVLKQYSTRSARKQGEMKSLAMEGPIAKQPTTKEWLDNANFQLSKQLIAAQNEQKESHSGILSD
ncbi:hypothetical protein PtB15_9B575 [Puccinia triticina]|nr:hypothetical protein PtB15_9B575 [Puccinia triticina]